MRIVYAILILCALNINIKAQGIKFFKGSYEELMKESKRLNKPVFIDFYTKW